MDSTLRRTTRMRAATLSTITLALLVTACSGSDGGSSDSSIAGTDAPSAVATTVAPRPSVASTEAAATTAAPTTVAPTTTSTTTTLPPQGSTLADPAPVGDPEFDLRGYDKNGSISGAHVFGMTELSLDEDETDPGTCVAIVGVMTLAESAAPATGFADLPSVELYTDGDVLRSGTLECEDAQLRAAGFDLLTDAVLVPGAQYAFGRAVFIPDGTVPAAIAVGMAGGSDGRFYEPTVLPALPDVPELAAGVVPADLRSTGDAAADPIRVEGALLDAESSFDVSIVGLLTTAPVEDRDVEGDCVTVLSTLKGIESVGAIINAFAVPDVSVLAGGRVHQLAIGDCDVDEIEAAGWGSPVGTGVAPGNTLAVATSFVVPAGAQPSAIFIGEPTRVGESWAFEPTALDELPMAPPLEGIDPELTLVAAGSSPTYAVEQFDTTWTGTIHGLVELPHDARSARCYAIVGTFDRAGDNEFPPSLGLIADGALRTSAISFARCDTAALEAAGYLASRDAAGAADGAEIGFFETIFMPVDHGPLAGIVVGNAASADEVVYVDPVVVSDVPAAP